MGWQTIETNDPSTIRMTLEVHLQNSPKSWQLIHNSAKTSDGDTRKVFTRIYELLIHGKGTGLGMKFFYDYRKGGKTYCTFDAVALKAIAHQLKGDYDEKKIEEYLKSSESNKQHRLLMSAVEACSLLWSRVRKYETIGQ